MIEKFDKISVWNLVKAYPAKMIITWGLTILETIMLGTLPLLIGMSIDGLLKDDWTPFTYLVSILAALIFVGVGRRIYDTRAYGTIRVDMGMTQIDRASDKAVSKQNARIAMGRELVDFLEDEAPESMTAILQIVIALVILYAFHPILSLTSFGAIAASLLLYGLFSKKFFRLNSALNHQAEKQVDVISKHNPKLMLTHFKRMRQNEVRISDTESILYGLIFFILLAMLSYNLWFAATQSAASVGEIFSIVTYSFEFIQSAITLPMILQSLTRLSEISERINK